MSVHRLITQNFRNLSGAPVVFHPDINFVIGDNGSGKSSLLEAIFYLGHGKSYRTSKVEHLVCHQASQFVVSIKDGKDRRLGVSRNLVNNQTEIKIDGEKFSRLSELAKNIAVQIITPESFKLFFGGPKERRRFVDLGMFHVKHEFANLWRDFSRILKQRNACLRSQQQASMLDYWTQLFCQHSEQVANLRELYISDLIAELKIWTHLLLPKIADQISVQYLRGWHQKKSLADVLQANKEREINFGSSLYGAHKFDVKFLLHKAPVDMLLSRGQQKLFLLALTFAQAKLIERVNRVKPIILIDDVGAELDLDSRSQLSKAIEQLNCQVLITAIDEGALQPLVPSIKNYKMFHVKHGEISAMNE